MIRTWTGWVGTASLGLVSAAALASGQMAAPPRSEAPVVEARAHALDAAEVHPETACRGGAHQGERRDDGRGHGRREHHGHHGPEGHHGHHGPEGHHGHHGPEGHHGHPHEGGGSPRGPAPG